MTLKVNIPPNWNIKDFYNLNYTYGTHNDPLLVDEYVQSGHNLEKLSIYKYHEPNPMPSCTEYVRKQFSFWDNVGVAVNYFKPGQYLPLHIDLYGKYIELTNVDPSNVMRCMVMLEDSSPGQILQVDQICYCKWYAGDCFYWNYETPHAFYNMSMRDRYALQITGTLK
jgi:hypothetical protein